MKNDRFISWGIFVLLCIIWGSSFILMKWGQEGMTGAQVASVRIFSSGLFFLPLAIFHFSKIPRQKLWLVLLAGVFGNLLPAYLFALAIAKNIDSSLAGILNSLTPIFVVVISILFFKSRVAFLKITGVTIGFAGLCLLTLSNRGISFDNLEYALWIVLATFMYGLTVNIVSHYLKEINPLHLASVSLAFMLIPTGLALWQQDILHLAFDESVIRWSLVSAVMLGIAGSAIASVLFYMLVNRAGGLFASLVTYGIPFVAIAWGLIYGEQVTFIQVGSLGVILGGVYLANK